MRRGALSCRTDPIAINRATRCCYRDFAQGHAPPVIPFLFFLYIAAWLDRVNVGFAALQMNSDLGFSSAAFRFGSAVFFLGYCLFEVPSNPSFVPRGSASLDRANHGELGRHLGRYDVCSDTTDFLCLKARIQK